MTLIEGFVGKPGSGKTYQMTERALVEKARGKTVFTNWPVTGCTYFDVENWGDLPAGVVMLDEAHLWFSARQAMRIPGEWLALLSQTRKRGWHVIWSAQHESRVDKVMRDLSSWIWLCNSLFPIGGQPRGFMRAAFEPENIQAGRQRQQRPDMRRISMFRKKVARAYDTEHNMMGTGLAAKGDS